MSRSRIIVLGLALVCALGAAWLAKGFLAAKPESEVVKEVVDKVAKIDILVAAKNMPMGDKVSLSKLQWQPWPKDLVQPFMITREAEPEAKKKLKGARARADLFTGEPINKKKLILPGSAGFMAAVLPKGMRAISVRISAETGAGGFILPNDRVDVLVTRKLPSSGSRDRTVSEAVVTNVRVLAVGHTFRQTEDGKEVVDGKTATLELTPRQAEVVARAENIGQLSLSLRSLNDNGDTALGDAGPKLTKKYARGGRGGEVTILRYGIEKQTVVNE